MDYVGKWYKAKILDCRLSKGNNNSIENWSIKVTSDFPFCPLKT